MMATRDARSVGIIWELLRHCCSQEGDETGYVCEQNAQLPILWKIGAKCSIFLQSMGDARDVFFSIMPPYGQSRISGRQGRFTVHVNKVCPSVFGGRNMDFCIWGVGSNPANAGFAKEFILVLPGLLQH